MRLFLSLHPDAAAAEAWQKFQLTAPTWPLRWSAPDQLHVTLKFFGETSAGGEADIVSAVSKVAADTAPFSLRLKGAGMFPPKGSPFILWLGLDVEIAALNLLVDAIEKECALLGFPKEDRLFHPHLTVSRLPTKRDGAKDLRWLRSAYEQWAAVFESQPFVVNEITLMESQLTPSGPRYTPRQRWPLGKSL